MGDAVTVTRRLRPLGDWLVGHCGVCGETARERDSGLQDEGIAVTRTEGGVELGVAHVIEAFDRRHMDVRFDPPDARAVLVSQDLLREFLAAWAAHRGMTIAFTDIPEAGEL